VLVRLGDHTAAAQVAAEIPRCFPADGYGARLAAEILARCLSLAAQDKGTSAAQRQALVKTYGDQAVVFLKQYLQQNPAADAEKLKKEPNFASLRSRPDFQELGH
jgi:hypothetical protein